MADIYRLRNQIKHYEWGSPEVIPRFLGVENAERLPCAEMWMGTHSGAPSQVYAGENRISLAEAAGGELPFLFKLIAAEKPLSIQAHPNLAQAAAGFERENKAGLALDDPRRNYKDANHKSEILCAITPFTVMAGFREPAEIKKNLEALTAAAPPLGEIFLPLLRAIETGSLADFFHALFKLSKQEREELGVSVKGVCETCGTVISGGQWKLMKNFAAQYPEDAAVISPLYLNLFTLESGQAMFVPAGALHAYINGFGVELMASSDNVLRGGLTSKHVDIGELMNILNFNPFMPEIITPPVSSTWFRYPAPCGDFSLSLIRGCGEKKVFPESGPAVCVVTEGELDAGGETFKKGESFFVPKAGRGAQTLVLGGNYSLFAACASP